MREEQRGRDVSDRRDGSLSSSVFQVEQELAIVGYAGRVI
jgi:hypothetical protein